MNGNTRNEILRESSFIVVTEAIRLRWDDGEMRLVNNTEKITIGGEDYAPCGLSFNPPSASGNDGKITIDDTDGRLTYILQSIERMEAEVSIIDAENPDEPLDGPVTFSVDSFTTSSDGNCNLVLTSQSRLSFGLSKLTYSPAIFPGLFG